MKKEILKKNWNILGEVDAPYYILTQPGKQHNWNLNDFFNTGKIEITGLMEYVNKNFPNLKKETSLDFGCGIGRLTNALAMYFKTVDGVDIAPSMIKKAYENMYVKNCNFYCLDNLENLNNRYDFIYSNIVLQHMEPKYSLQYIKQFFKKLNINGVCIFQLPYFSKIKIKYEEINEKNFIPRMEMYTVDREKVKEIGAKSNVELIEIIDDKDAGSNFLSCKYIFLKTKE